MSEKAGWTCAAVGLMLIPGCVAEERGGSGNAQETLPGIADESGQAAHWTELSPGLRIDRERSLLEFDGAVAVDCHNPATPDVFLELVVCSPDTREHESLVVSDVPPSLIHAGLLAIGFEPGSPGRVEFARGESVRTPATGERLRVGFIRGEDGSSRLEPGLSWIVDAETRTRRPPGGWVFAGSRFVERRGMRVYDADGAGTVIGLASFGSETIASTLTIHPEAAFDEPVWIADPSRVPRRGSRVRVRIGRR